jgi:hypothetical protein
MELKVARPAEGRWWAASGAKRAGVSALGHFAPRKDAGSRDP